VVYNQLVINIKKMDFAAIILGCLGILVVLAVGLVLFAIGLFNTIQRLVVLVDEAWSGIDVQLKKRFDLIPNIVESVKGYAKHESELFEKVAGLRSGMMTTSSPEELGKMEGELRATLKTLFAVAESYPELKANENFLKLQDSLQEIEDELEGARRYYNGVVRDLNQQIVVFPNNIIAGYLGLKKREFFVVENETERQNVKVDFTSEAK
jgi:LemA protein